MEERQIAQWPKGQTTLIQNKRIHKNNSRIPFIVLLNNSYSEHLYKEVYLRGI